MALSLPAQYQAFLPRFYQLAVVSALSNMMVPLAGIFDTAFLGHLKDIRYLAGVILGSILFDYLYRVLKFLRNSTNAITAQAAGQGDQNEVLLAGLRSGVIAVAIATLILLLQWPIAHFGFMFLAGSPDIEAAGLNYFNARIWGAPAVLLNFVFIGWFLGREMKGAVLVLSLVGNGSNVLLDYLMIQQWGWASTGAGLATALSQYLALLVALIYAGFSIKRSAFTTALQNLWDWTALKATVALKSNILIRFVALISAYALFTNFSATLGTTVLAENGLLLQIALLSQFTVNGLGLTTQTLIGNAKGQEATEQMMPILLTAIGNAILLALIFAFVSVSFPQTIFGLFTNHTEVSQAMRDYTAWLVPLLSLTAVAFMLEGFFIGLKEGAILRNAALIAFGIGFLPVAIAGLHFQSNHLLWGALTSYMTAIILFLSIQLPKRLPITKPAALSTE
ncbi:DNA damage-inducible protein F [Acaryochloris thomasi RCC1774]|uniref:DNA damage-inducible protein F n=1 Tax=Acaryochloris thomasi RCC1774 TaxID=1764569 RepID=A0A2W1K591_9CYAN|nr:guanitoxin biosynthesis MATE family efflux transporter GntT [Acaryochloris thomasi]PZD75081.1 DNA damage-inducible protein F [Acaryochloris thomasi RCC1774]